MKLMHLADLHLGKRLHSLSLVEDQAYWIEKLLAYINISRPDAVVLAGDVYDRSDPAKEAVPLLSRLLSGIADAGIPVLLIAGNHDGGVRLEFLSELLKKENIYIAGTVKKELTRCTFDFHDGYGPVTFYLMPYLFPAAVREALGLGDDVQLSYTDAVRMLLEAQPIDTAHRNVLIAHQTVMYADAAPERSGSETAVFIGGTGAVDASVFHDFDYVALGHLHGAQKVGSDRIRYAGAPLAYHFSEAGQKKGALEVALGEKGRLPEIALTELPVLHRVRPVMRGTAAEITARETESTARNEYVAVQLTERAEPGTREALAALFSSHGCRLLDISRAPEEYTPQEADPQREQRQELTLAEEFLAFYRKRKPFDDPDDKEQALIHFAAERITAIDGADTDALADAVAAMALSQEEEI